MSAQGCHSNVTGSPSRPSTKSPDPVTLPLHLWRRLDWRFLLPDPRLGTVVCCAQADEDLLAALQLIKPIALRVMPTSQLGLDAEGWADVAVLISPSATDVRQAVHAIRPGGWIYAEVSRSVLSGGRGTHTLLGVRRAFRAAGLHDTVLHWHAPDFASRARIVPLDQPEIVRGTLLRYEHVRFGHLKSLLGRGALRIGLFPLSVAQGSVLGRRPGNERSDLR